MVSLSSGSREENLGFKFDDAEDFFELERVGTTDCVGLSIFEESTLW